MNRFFKKPITKKSKTDVNPTDEQPENTIPASSDGAKIPTVKKRHSSTGKAPDPDTVARATPSRKPPAKPQYVIPRCNPMEENPLSVLPEVLLTEEERLAQARPLTLPPEVKLALETLRTAADWREAVAAFKVDWQINNEDRNRTFHEHNSLRVLKLLEEYRAGTHDVVCDNLAQFYLVKEVVDDYQQARRKAKLDQEAQLEHQKWLLREKLSGKSALFSESQPQARPDPFLGTRATPVGGKFPAGRPDANPLTGARSTPGGGKFPAGGPDECLSPATVPDGSYSPVDESVASPVVGAGVGQGVSTPSGEATNLRRLFEGQRTGFAESSSSTATKSVGRESATTGEPILLSHSLVKLTPLIQEEERVLTRDMVQRFVDNCRRATANGQRVNVSALIPPNHQEVIDFQLMALLRPTIRSTATLEELYQNLFALVVDEAAKAHTPAEQEATFFQEVTHFLSHHDYYPATRSTMSKIILELQRMQTDAGLSSEENLRRFTAEESAACLGDVLTALAKRVRNHPEETRLGKLYKYLTLRPQAEFTGLIRKPATLADFCAALMSFAVECERLVAIVGDLGKAQTPKRKPLENSGGAGFREKGTLQGPPANASIHAVRAQRDNPRCEVCNRPNHQTAECSFRPSATPGNVHPLVEQLKGRPFSNSDVARRLRKAVRENPHKPGTYVDRPCKSIPFGLTLTKIGERQVLVPTSKGPVNPYPQSGEAPETPSKVRFNNIEIIPTNEAILEDISSLFNVKTLSSAETEVQVTAQVVDAENRDSEKIEVTRVLLDSGALNYNFITCNCVNKNKFKRCYLKKTFKNFFDTWDRK